MHAEPEANADHRANQAQNLSILFRSIFESSPLPMATVVGAGHIVSYVNPSFCRLFGKTIEEVTGTSFAELVSDDRCLSILDRVYRTGNAENLTESELSDGRTAYWSYAMWPVLDADERPAGVLIQVTETAHFHRQVTAINEELLLSAVRQHELAEAAKGLNAQLQLEITERKRVEGALLTSEKLAATARLAHTMAHEINNPLGAITNLVYLLGPLQTSPEAKGYVAMLEEQVKGLTRIATQMLKFHRDSNRPTEFKLGELVSEISEIYRFQAERQGITVHQRIETDGIVVGFKSEIIQVVSNLLINAFEAAPNGGMVSVHLYPAPTWLCELHDQCGYCLSIADTGRGIEREHYKRIFEPFFTTKGDKGSGLGLWLCVGIVNRVGGSIRVWSRRTPGRSGTCFSVFLPAQEVSFTPLRRRYERHDRSADANRY